MIDSIASILRSLVMLLTLCLVLFVGWKGYQAYKFFEAKFIKVEKYLAKTDEVLGQHDRLISRIHSAIEKWKPGEKPVDEELDISCMNPECTCKAPCTCGRCECGLEPEPQAMKPTVVLYSLEGCGPCEQWWRDKAPQWMRAGWVVKREISTTSQPTPYWKVWDGDKWLDFQGKLDFDTYKAKGGR